MISFSDLKFHEKIMKKYSKITRKSYLPELFFKRNQKFSNPNKINIFFHIKSIFNKNLMWENYSLNSLNLPVSSNIKQTEISFPCLVSRMSDLNLLQPTDKKYISLYFNSEKYQTQNFFNEKIPGLQFQDFRYLALINFKFIFSRFSLLGSSNQQLQIPSSHLCNLKPLNSANSELKHAGYFSSYCSSLNLSFHKLDFFEGNTKALISKIRTVTQIDKNQVIQNLKKFFWKGYSLHFTRISLSFDHIINSSKIKPFTTLLVQQSIHSSKKNENVPNIQNIVSKRTWEIWQKWDITETKGKFNLTKGQVNLKYDITKKVNGSLNDYRYSGLVNKSHMLKNYLGVSIKKLNLSAFLDVGIHKGTNLDNKKNPDTNLTLSFKFKIQDFFKKMFSFFNETETKVNIRSPLTMLNLSSSCLSSKFSLLIRSHFLKDKERSLKVGINRNQHSSIIYYLELYSFKTHIFKWLNSFNQYIPAIPQLNQQVLFSSNKLEASQLNKNKKFQNKKLRISILNIFQPDNQINQQENNSETEVFILNSEQQVGQGSRKFNSKKISHIFYLFRHFKVQKLTDKLIFLSETLFNESLTNEPKISTLHTEYLNIAKLLYPHKNIHKTKFLINNLFFSPYGVKGESKNQKVRNKKLPFTKKSYPMELNNFQRTLFKTTLKPYMLLKSLKKIKYKSTKVKEILCYYKKSNSQKIEYTTEAFLPSCLRIVTRNGLLFKKYTELLPPFFRRAEKIQLPDLDFLFGRKSQEKRADTALKDSMTPSKFKSKSSKLFKVPGKLFKPYLLERKSKLSPEISKGEIKNTHDRKQLIEGRSRLLIRKNLDQAKREIDRKVDEKKKTGKNKELIAFESLWKNSLIFSAQFSSAQYLIQNILKKTAFFLNRRYSTDPDRIEKNLGSIHSPTESLFPSTETRPLKFLFPDIIYSAKEVDSKNLFREKFSKILPITSKKFLKENIQRKSILNFLNQLKALNSGRIEGILIKDNTLNFSTPYIQILVYKLFKLFHINRCHPITGNYKVSILNISGNERISNSEEYKSKIKSKTSTNYKKSLSVFSSWSGEIFQKYFQLISELKSKIPKKRFASFILQIKKILNPISKLNLSYLFKEFNGFNSFWTFPNNILAYVSAYLPAYKYVYELLYKLVYKSIYNKENNKKIQLNQSRIVSEDFHPFSFNFQKIEKQESNFSTSNSYLRIGQYTEQYTKQYSKQSLFKHNIYKEPFRPFSGTNKLTYTLGTMPVWLGNNIQKVKEEPTDSRYPLFGKIFRFADTLQLSSILNLEAKNSVFSQIKTAKFPLFLNSNDIESNNIETHMPSQVLMQLFSIIRAWVIDNYVIFKSKLTNKFDLVSSKAPSILFKNTSPYLQHLIRVFSYLETATYSGLHKGFENWRSLNKPIFTSNFLKEKLNLLDYFRNTYSHIFYKNPKKKRELESEKHYLNENICFCKLSIRFIQSVYSKYMRKGRDEFERPEFLSYLSKWNLTSNKPKNPVPISKKRYINSQKKYINQILSVYTGICSDAGEIKLAFHNLKAIDERNNSQFSPFILHLGQIPEISYHPEYGSPKIGGSEHNFTYISARKEGKKFDEQKIPQLKKLKINLEFGKKTDNIPGNPLQRSSNNTLRQKNNNGQVNKRIYAPNINSLVKSLIKLHFFFSSGITSVRDLTKRTRVKKIFFTATRLEEKPEDMQGVLKGFLFRSKILRSSGQKIKPGISAHEGIANFVFSGKDGRLPIFLTSKAFANERTELMHALATDQNKAREDLIYETSGAYLEEVEKIKKVIFETREIVADHLGSHFSQKTQQAGSDVDLEYMSEKIMHIINCKLKSEAIRRGIFCLAQK